MKKKKKKKKINPNFANFEHFLNLFRNLEFNGSRKKNSSLIRSRFYLIVLNFFAILAGNRLILNETSSKINSKPW